MDPDVLVLDEPTSGLDPSGSEDLMELLDELNHDCKTVVISTHDVELAYPWADRAILLLDGRILQEDVPEVAFGNPDHVRMAHLSVPTLLDLSLELGRRGFARPERKPRSVLDMVPIIENFQNRSCGNDKQGSISVCNVDEERDTPITPWVNAHPGIVVGAMGTRAKQRASQEQLNLAVHVRRHRQMHPACPAGTGLPDPDHQRDGWTGCGPGRGVLPGEWKYHHRYPAEHYEPVNRKRVVVNEGAGGFKQNDPDHPENA